MPPSKLIVNNIFSPKFCFIRGFIIKGGDCYMYYTTIVSYYVGLY